MEGFYDHENPLLVQKVVEICACSLMTHTPIQICCEQLQF